MNLTHDYLKNRYVYYGYFDNYPYHMISDAEMCDAFLSEDSECYFYDNYPILAEELTAEYQALVDALYAEIDKLKAAEGEEYRMPDWVYTYMIGSVISVNSDWRDRHDLLTYLGIADLESEFTAEAQRRCYDISADWVRKLSGENIQPATMFGAPHVLKSIRLEEANIYIE